MSNLAIAAVTTTLRSILQAALTNGSVTTLPLDRAAAVGGPANRLNLFLYHMAPNAAWRNQTIPNKVKSGEQGHPPLALNLYYLLTAYGDDQPTEIDHQLLGKGMQILHDSAVLTAEAIRNANSEPSLRSSNLDRQFEQIKITPEPLTLDEMSRLWQTFQTQYRISAAYQASVVFIESTRQQKSPLPVLKRGEQDQGVEIIPTMPGVLDGIEYRDLRTRDPAFSAAQLGDVVTLLGRQLPGRRCKVLFIDPRRKATVAEPEANVVGRAIPEDGSNDTKIYVRLDPTLTTWTSGPLQVLLQDPPPPAAVNGQPPPRKRAARSNALRFGLAPSLLLDNAMPFVVAVENGRRQLVLNCNPGITRNADGTWPDVMLILSPIINAPSVPPLPMNLTSLNLSATTPVFDVESVPSGAYRVRVRIETVETLVMRRNGITLDFDERQVVSL
ncbi:MAG: DUF4255 domain-containing protein [Candidatus Saccharimonas sp.]|nr:DUF4255 domain-containing protein [Planctomycetaceae bacterium]